MPLPLGALAGWVAAGHIAFDQRTAQRLGNRRKLMRESLSALAERQFGESGQLATCLHLNASIRQHSSPNANANLLECESPPMYLI